MFRYCILDDSVQGIFKSLIGFHHCVALVETIEMHTQNVQFRIRVKELRPLEDCLPDNIANGLVWTVQIEFESVLIVNLHVLTRRQTSHPINMPRGYSSGGRYSVREVRFSLGCCKERLYEGVLVCNGVFLVSTPLLLFNSLKVLMLGSQQCLCSNSFKFQFQ